MHRYRKIPEPVEIIEAMEYTYPASLDLLNWLGDAAGNEREGEKPSAIGEIDIYRTFGSGTQIKNTIKSGNWIIKDGDRRFYRCHADMFRSTYEAIKESDINTTIPRDKSNG